MSRLHLFVLCLLSTSVDAGHVYTDSFPSTEEEYDASVLDPHHAAGHPYGGYSRATRSRLAALPLHLPETTREKAFGENDAIYMQVRDAEGRLFACRVYHEDELEPASLYDSMFDAPKLRRPVMTEEGTDQRDSSSSYDNVAKKEQKPDIRTTVTVEGSTLTFSIKANEATYAIDEKTGKVTELRHSDAPPDDAKKKKMRSETEMLALVNYRLQDLSLLCGQIHRGWWSYEWCYQAKVTQFHIELDATTSQVKVDSLTNLGNYVSRTVVTDLHEAAVNELAQDVPELARVVDVHDNGDVCDETKKPRKTYVQYQCCSGKMMNQRRGMFHKAGKPVESNLAAVYDVVEDPDHVCTYNVTVCTPLLCGDNDDDDEKQDVSSSTTGDIESPFTRALLSSKPSPDDSIRTILDKTLRKTCLQTNAGWWTYEFCHKQYVRQFHEAAATRRNQATGAMVTSKVIETEHSLGKYDPDKYDSIPDEEEYKLVVNATDQQGTSAYLEVEYTGGDVCEHPDVTESAIVAGTAGGSMVERAATVRYSCGSQFDVSVNEDSTCHYIVQVTVPDLCIHPTFKKPVSKKQVIKCLPVE